jgi:N-acyl-D-amino-acid deacylase
MRLLALLTLLAASCSSDTAPGVVDAGTRPADAPRPAVDAAAAAVDATSAPDAAGHTAAQIQACEAQLAADWKQTPPVVGLGTSSARASYQKVIGGLMASFSVPGGAVAVTKNGRLVLALGLGLADVAAEEPAHADDLFRVASLSKQLTATAVMQLVADGSLDLDESAFDIVSDLAPIDGATKNPDLDQITVRDLLQHTGGWNRDHELVGDPMFNPDGIADDVGAPAPASCETVIRYMLDKPLSYAPGTTYCYSNFGYCVLGRIIERRAHMAYADYVKQMVLGPAGIEDMAVGRSLLADATDGEVHYYDYPGAPLADSVFPSSPGTVPWPYGGFYLEAMDSHGAWIASPIDYLRFQVRIDGLASPPDLITADEKATMIADPHVATCNSNGTTTPEDPKYWYGFGLQANSYGNLWHTGSLPGTATEDVIAQNGFSWAAFFNTRPSAGSFFNQLDSGLWTALGGAGTWSGEDYFDQFVPFSAWMSPADYATLAANGAAAGSYPIRVEGRAAAGVVQLRAQIVPRHPGVASSTITDADCVDFRAAESAATGSGQALVSLQRFVDAGGVSRFQATWATPK